MDNSRLHKHQIAEHFFDRPLWVFDLDNTLYSANQTLFPDVDRLIKTFIMDRFNVDRDEAHRIQKGHLAKYGLTMRGLMQENAVDPQEFLRHIHDLDFSLVPADPQLDALLSGLEGQKYIFTNSPLDHTVNVLDRLGISRHFDGIYDIEAANYVPKPDKMAFDGMISHFALDPTRAIMVEDSSRNLAPAHRMGMATLWLDIDCEWGRIDHDMRYVDATTTNLNHWLADFIAQHDQKSEKK